MRILFVADMVPDQNLGAAGTEIQTSRALRALGCHVEEIWAQHLPHRIKHGNLHYLLELPRAFRAAVQHAFRRSHFDVVRANQPHGFLAGEWLLEAHPNAVFVHRSHGLEVRANEVLGAIDEHHSVGSKGLIRQLASTAMERMLARHTVRAVKVADGHEVYATDDRAFLIDRFNVPPSRIAVIPGAPPPELLDTPAPPMTTDRLRRVLYVSQFAFFKAPMVVAAAMNALAARNPQLRFTWVCDRRHHPEVAASVTAPVELLDWMPQAELRQAFDSHGTFLFPSFYEGFGKVFLEAMSRGAVPVATDIAGAHDVITSGVDGFLVPTNDVTALIDRVEDLLRDATRAAAISTAAAATARRYTWERAAEETLNFYESLIRMKHAGT